MIIYAGSKGQLDKIPRNQVAAWEAQFLTFMREQRSEVRNAILKEGRLRTNEKKQVDDDRLNAAIADFQHQYKPVAAASR